ncbi:acyl-CoA reductase [Verrucomicrobiaceae bacterium 227]
MTTAARLDLIATSVPFFEPFTGPFDRALLQETWDRELSAPTVRLPKNLVHIISGNTPHAAYQSLLNGLILGAHNRLKLPSNALLDFHLPPAFAHLIETSRTLPDHWIPEADALVVFGSDQTLRHFQQLCPLETPFIGHGHRYGIGIINDPTPEAAALAARDIGLFDQNGCLSLQTLYLEDPVSFAPLLALAMADFEKEHPRSQLPPSDAGAITNLREEIRFLSANDPANHQLRESPGTTAWTIIYQNSPDPVPSPGNRTIYLRPFPRDQNFAHFQHLSGIALHPFSKRTDLPSPRIFPLGQAQSPPALWAHDGLLPLAALVKHQTISRPHHVPT